MKLKDAALVAAAVLSHRYITDRFLPDKAIDLVDEAAAKLRMEIDSMPSELDEVRRRIMQLEIEREALRKERDQASRERLAKLEKELADLKEQDTQLRAHWEQEKEVIQNVRKLREALERLRLEIEAAQRVGRIRQGVRAPVREAAGAGAADPGTGGEARPAPETVSGCSRRRSTRRTSPRSSPSGPTSR